MALWNVTIDDSSPFLTYTPYSDGFGSSNGWEAWYSESAFHTQPGNLGNGDSSHLTALNGATVSLQFYGSNVYLYGNTSSSYDITLDNVVYTSVTPTADVLYATTNLATTMHYLTLTARPTNFSQQLSFDRAIVSSPVDSSGQPPQAMIYDNTNTTGLNYTTGWSIASGHGIPNASVTAPFHTTKNKGTSVSINFSGGEAVAVNGPSNWGNWEYSVVLDGSQVIRNGSSLWLVPDALLFYQGGLDPTKTHSINVTNLSDNMTFSLNSVTVYKPQSATTTTVSSTTSSSSNNAASSTHNTVSAGIIAGPIVAALCITLICAFLWWRYRRNYRRNREQERRALDSLMGASDFPSRPGSPWHHSTISGPQMMFTANVPADPLVPTDTSPYVYDANFGTNVLLPPVSPTRPSSYHPSMRSTESGRVRPLPMPPGVGQNKRSHSASPLVQDDRRLSLKQLGEPLNQTLGIDVESPPPQYSLS